MTSITDEVQKLLSDELDAKRWRAFLTDAYITTDEYSSAVMLTVMLSSTIDDLQGSTPHERRVLNGDEPGSTCIVEPERIDQLVDAWIEVFEP